MRTALLLILLPATALAGGTEVATRDGGNLQRPVWSPDGQQLGYEANFHEQKRIELYVGNPTTKAFQRITPAARGISSMAAGFASTTASGQVAHELSWSPPAIGRFVYSATNDMSDYDLYIAGGGAIAPGPGADGGAAWSANGRWIAFTSARTGQGDLYLIDVNAVEKPPRQLTRDKTSAELYVTWSSEGKLAWVGHSSSTGDNIWLLPSVDSAPVKLTSMAGAQTRPRFSPDGKKIAFYATAKGDDGADRWDLYITDSVMGSAPVMVRTDIVPNAIGPVWHPNNTELIVVVNDSEHFDPVLRIPVGKGEAVSLDLGTVGHGDHDVARGKDGVVRLAYVAQGLVSDRERTFKRLFVATLE